VGNPVPAPARLRPRHRHRQVPRPPARAARGTAREGAGVLVCAAGVSCRRACRGDAAMVSISPGIQVYPVPAVGRS
jgi:hypothetical protein